MKKRNLILIAVIMGAGIMMQGCVEKRQSGHQISERANNEKHVSFVTDERIITETVAEKSLIQTELENTHDFWEALGSTCPCKIECVKEGLRYFNASPIHRAPYGFYSTASGFQGTVTRSEIRHAGMVRN